MLNNWYFAKFYVITFFKSLSGYVTQEYYLLIRNDFFYQQKGDKFWKKIVDEIPSCNTDFANFPKIFPKAFKATEIGTWKQTHLWGEDLSKIGWEVVEML